MPRDAAGNYTLPAGNPVVSGSVITSTWANTTMPDLADAITNSLSRNGNGGMLVPLLFLDGTAGAPGIAFTNEPTTGFYRAGAGDLRATVQGTDAVRFTNSEQLEVFRDAAWRRVADTRIVDKPVGALEFGWNPNGVYAGTWTQLPEGTFVMSTVAGADPAGGSNDAVLVAHDHDIDHGHGVTDPGHNHQAPADFGAGVVGGAFFVSSTVNRDPTLNTTSKTTGITVDDHVGKSSIDGVSATGANRPLYKGVAVWERTA